MKLACSQLLRMRVYTSSGTYVGKVKDVSFDPDLGTISEYLVRKMFSPPVTIAHARVVKFEKDRLIVEDRVGILEETRTLTQVLDPVIE